MNTLLLYFVLGVSLAAPVGPVKTVLLNTGIKNGFFHAWFFSLGSIATDVLYMGAVYFGIGKFIHSPLLQIILWSFGCFVLLYTGIENLLKLNRAGLDPKAVKRDRLRKSIISGFFMSMFNPITILFWLGIYGSMLARTAGMASGTQILLNSFAILAGIMVVDFILSFLSNGARRLLSAPLLTFVSLLSSFSMIGFGLYFGLQAYQALFS
ncbi:amino acid transporter [Sporosarcina sp. NCCP-2716]|uniref:LysE family translocator n=1 Tax=Sporosarcina sp. NCCP-2716 TaxID=2943679 RepID=UPI0020400407|nr:LysE family transporter [Sporosarcina sp. NCCP-2716]GKV68867.1 amino acid transporter [Sporosarcina sp. NCCP-2716]